MNKSTKYGNKVKKNKTKRRRKISGGRKYGYKATLVVYPVYKLGSNGKPTDEIKSMNEFGSSVNNMSIPKRFQKIDNLIDLTMNDGSLVQDGVIPAVHILTGKHPNKKKETPSTGEAPGPAPAGEEGPAPAPAGATPAGAPAPAPAPPPAPGTGTGRGTGTGTKAVVPPAVVPPAVVPPAAAPGTGTTATPKPAGAPAGAPKSTATTAEEDKKAKKAVIDEMQSTGIDKKINRVYPDTKERATKITTDFPEFASAIGRKHYKSAKELLSELLIKPENRESLKRLIEMDDTRRN